MERDATGNGGNSEDANAALADIARQTGWHCWQGVVPLSMPGGRSPARPRWSGQRTRTRCGEPGTLRPPARHADQPVE